MKEFLNLKVYVPDRLFLEETILKVKLIGKEGSFTILPKHLDYISSFNDGVLMYLDLENNKRYLAINQGILVKVGREVKLSLFHAIEGSDLNKLKENVKELALKSDELINKDKQLKTSLKNIEFFIFEKLMRLKKYK